MQLSVSTGWNFLEHNMLKRLLWFLFFLTTPLLAQTQTIVTGQVERATSGYVEFQIQPWSTAVQYFIPGTTTVVFQTTRCAINGSGNVVGLAGGNCLVWGNNLISPANTTYTVVFAPANVITNRVAKQNISGASYSLNTPVFVADVKIVPQFNTVTTDPINTNITPSVDNKFNIGTSGAYYANAYIRNLNVDSFSNLQSILVCNNNRVKYVGTNGCFAGADIGAQINAAYAAGDSKGVTIVVLPQDTCYAFTTPIVFNTVSKPALLMGMAASGNTNDTTQGGVCLDYTPTTSTVALTADWVNPGGNGFFGAGSGVRDIAIINGSGCQTQGGCGSLAIGIQIGGTHGGTTSATFQNVKLEGFGTCLKMASSASSAMFGNQFVNVDMKSCTTGYSFANASEGNELWGGLIVNGGRAIDVVADVNTRVYGTHIINNSNVDAVNCAGNALIEFHGARFENVNLDSATYPNRHFITSPNCFVMIFGGDAIDSVASGNTNYWFSFASSAGAFVSGLRLGTAGRTASNVMLFNGPAVVTYNNGSPSILTSVCAAASLLTTICTRADTTDISTRTPSVELVGSAGTVRIKAASGVSGKTVTFADITGEPVLRMTRQFSTADVAVSASSGTCPTAASIGATCTTANLTIPNSVTMSGTSYSPICLLAASASGVPVIVRANRATATTFNVTIAALTAVAAEAQTLTCIFADQN